ncbi:ATP-dependent rRNA helicase SPB4 [Babesia sp. Xinjiang]|uniref:ATP-dependent rRNA helicase SPB4 n=1 Tax=Babesia sp. Xinjiang TaxID=462227 RepID=UPI000A24CF9C|nr:ATP-dependent rRNA helicase SPB4 [Babesia sp. Xinjiang]ORM40600.1 ATP-dependent rRNA helicase SPB4 [Babesia sp. Xinjiang]
MARAVRLRRLAAAAQPTPDHVGASLARCIAPLTANVRVWGSSLVELNPHLSPILMHKKALAFIRRFKRVRLCVNGRMVVPNGIQLSSLRPQLAGGDLFIAAPQHSGKTFLYLLPQAIHHAYTRVNGADSIHYKTLVLVPTLDLVLLGSRSAAGVLRQTSNVLALYYRDVTNGHYKTLIPKADIIYTTPQCALKAILGAPNVFKDLRALVLDEAQRLLKVQSAPTVLRVKSLLQPDIQTIVLAPRNDHMLREIVSRALRVDMKLISFCTEYDGYPVARHFWGPQRSTKFHVLRDVNLHETCPAEPTNGIELNVQQSRTRVIENSQTKDIFVDRHHQSEYILYNPSNISQLIYWTATRGTKTVIFFPTVRMTQFCYIYFKHLVGIDRQLHALHGGLSPEKRRYTIDLFSSIDDGVLFCTDIASLGLNLGKVDLVVHVGAPESVDVLADRANIVQRGDNDGNNLLLLHDLDAHVLYEAAQLNCNITPRQDTCHEGVHFEVLHSWVNNPCYLASCELMYRSLIGYYCNHAYRLKFQRWQVPSLIYELIRSFGFENTFSVTKQFASRLQLWDAPGLVVENKSAKKTELQAAAAAYPGFRSRFLQTNTATFDYMAKTCALIGT